ncbi:MAG: zinc-ribbon domain-containing protein [Alphaproteobacteria bacterium]|nr:zinc-ribbon domain-containing protein [Alphaproteobacteria bacterium]
MSFFCHVCSQQSDRHYVTPGVNDLKTYSAEIVAEWDYQRNGELTPDKVMPFSNRKVWWQCAMGHHWQCSVQIRQKGTGCPYCAGKVHRGSLLI